MPGNNSGTAVQSSSDKFIIPHWGSWHFERGLMPRVGQVQGRYKLIRAGEADKVKALESYAHHPVAGYDVASIEIVYNDALNRAFDAVLFTLNEDYGNPKSCPQWKSDADTPNKRWRGEIQSRFARMAEPYKYSQAPHVKILPMWHGTKDDIAMKHIFSSGYRVFTSNDPDVVTDLGFFGKGIYTAHEAEYSFRVYAEKYGSDAVLILNWVASFEAYPVIDGDMPKLRGKMGGFDQSDAHFIPVQSSQHPHAAAYYPCAPNQDHQYNELVVFNYFQCLPRYRVKLVKNSPMPSLSSGHYEAGQTMLDLGDYAQVARPWVKAYQANYPGAYVRLHWWYSGASGVMTKDDGALSSLTEPTSEVFGQLQARVRLFGLNDAESQFLLGWCYEQGLCGVEKKPALAAQYYWVAASQNHRDALYHLGLCCSTGFGVAQNMSQAVNYYGLASQQNHVHAHYVLSQCYTLGLGVAPDAVKATTYRQQAQQGHHPVMVAALEREYKVNTLHDDVKRKKVKIGQLKQDVKQEATKVTQLEKVVSQKQKELQDQQQQLQQQASQADRLKQNDKKQTAQIKRLEKTNGDQANRLLEHTKKVSELRQILLDKEKEIITLRQVQKGQPAKQSAGDFFGIGAKVKALERRLIDSKLLECIGRANEDDLKAVGKMLKTDSVLIFAQGKLIEPNGREFYHISAWQHVLWSGDPNLMSMLLAHMGSDADLLAYAREQYCQLLERPEELSHHGSSYDLQPLIDADQKYLDNYRHWSYEQCEYHWCKVIGGLQRLLPTWIMYAWYEEGTEAGWVKKVVRSFVVRDPLAVHRFIGGGVGYGNAVLRGGISFDIRQSFDMGYLLYQLVHDRDSLKNCKQAPEAREVLKATLYGEDFNTQLDFAASPAPAAERNSPFNRGLSIISSKLEAKYASGVSKINFFGSKLLRHIGCVAGYDMRAVEEILAYDPYSIFAQNMLIEHHGRKFHCISAWQYVLWSGDPGLMNMLLAHMGSDVDLLACAREQYDQLIERPEEISDHGSNYDLELLIDADQKYLDKYYDWSDEQLEYHWCKVIGGLQRQLPAWIMFAWSEEGAEVGWVKKSARGWSGSGKSFNINPHSRGELFTDARVGYDCAILRGRFLRAFHTIASDYEYLQHDRDCLKNCRHTPEARELLKARLQGDKSDPVDCADSSRDVITPGVGLFGSFVDSDGRSSLGKMFACVGRANEKDLRSIQKFLNEQPKLLFEQGKLVEPNGREFRNISAWQHVLWTGDPDLLRMMLVHVSGDADLLVQARNQYDQLAERPEEIGNHGPNYDIQPLIDAGQKYLSKYNGWDYQQRTDHWCKEVGGQQRLLPAWIMHAWDEEGGNAAWVKQSVSGFKPDAGVSIKRGDNSLEKFIKNDGGRFGSGVVGTTRAVVRGVGSGCERCIRYLLGDSYWWKDKKFDVKHLQHDLHLQARCKHTVEAREYLKMTLNSENCSTRAGLLVGMGNLGI